MPPRRIIHYGFSAGGCIIRPWPDLIQGDIYAGWSLRYIKQSYADLCLPVAKVQRLDGLVHEDLYPNFSPSGVGDYLLTAGGDTIATIAAGQACYYSTIYDQSGNGLDAVNQSTIANGLLAYTGASYVNIAGKPAFLKASNGYFSAPTSIAQPFTFFGYAALNTQGIALFLYDSTLPITSARAGLFSRGTGDAIAMAGNTTYNAISPRITFNFFSAHYNGASSYLELDATTSALGNVGAFPAGPTTLLSANSSLGANAWGASNYCQEIIIISGEPSTADKNAIKAYY
jgi:hypothetical protein